MHVKIKIKIPSPVFIAFKFDINWYLSHYCVCCMMMRPDEKSYQRQMHKVIKVRHRSMIGRYLRSDVHIAVGWSVILFLSLSMTHIVVVTTEENSFVVRCCPCCHTDSIYKGGVCWRFFLFITKETSGNTSREHRYYVPFLAVAGHT